MKEVTSRMNWYENTEAAIHVCYESNPISSYRKCWKDYQVVEESVWLRDSDGSILQQKSGSQESSLNGKMDGVDTMKVERTNAEIVENALPDGSRVIIDSRNDRVYALNATAGAAWDACVGPVTLTEVTERMRRSLNPAVTEDLAEQAVASLQEQNLVIASNASAGTSRRQVLASLGAIALPLVVSMTLSDQKAYAKRAGSGHQDDDGETEHFNRPDAIVSKSKGPRD